MQNYLKYKGYLGVLEFNATDEKFYGRVHAINDLVSFEGSSVEALKNAFREAVDDYLSSCAAAGKVPDKTFKGSFNVRIDRDLHRKAALVAVRKGISLNDFVRKAIAYAIVHEKDMDTVN